MAETKPGTSRREFLTTVATAGAVAAGAFAALGDPEVARAQEAARFAVTKGARIHELPATPDTCFWGFFDNSLPPVLRVNSGDILYIETLTHQAGDAPDLLMDDGVRDVYTKIPSSQRGPGVHIMTGPVYVEGAEPGDTLEVRILGMTPRLPYGTNIAAWWGYLYDDFKKERITIYKFDVGTRLARAEFAFDYTTTPRYDQVGIVTPPDLAAREKVLRNVVVPMRPHFGVSGVGPKESGKINSIPPWTFGGNVDNWRIGAGATMYYPVFNQGALFYMGDPHMAEGDAELSGTAIEASANAWVQVVVRKDFPITNPILETETHWITHGFDQDLNKAMKMAARQMLVFLAEKKGLAPDEAYSLMSVAADFAVTQVVDIRQGVHAAIPKSVFLPT
jgi:acetamidase/formamidase